MWFRQIVAGGLVWGALCGGAVSAWGAPATDERTVLYYLMEMQRQRGTPCPGTVRGSAPHLIPSEQVAVLAQEIAQTGDSAEALKPLFGLQPEDAVFAAVVSAPAAQGALNQLKDAVCSDVMGPQYTFVGAAKQGNMWTVVLAGRNPVVPAELPSGRNAVPVEPRGTVTDAMAVDPTHSASQDATLEQGASSGPYATEEAAPPALIAPPAPVAPVVQKARPGITPLTEAPLAAQSPVDMEYVAPGADALAAGRAMPGGAEGAGMTAVAGMGATQGRAVGQKPGTTLLVDKNGRQVAVEIIGDSSDELPSGGMVVDKQSPEGFSGEAPRDFMRQGTGVAAPRESAVLGGGQQSVVSAEKHYPNTSGSAGVIAATSAEARSMFELINAKRHTGQLCGSTLRKAPPLRLSTALTGVAQAHAEDMGSKGYFSSTAPDGSGVQERLAAAGYTWIKAGEVIAVSRPPAQDVLQQWLTNPDQCSTLLNPELKEAGIGFSSQYNLWVITLGDPGL